MSKTHMYDVTEQLGRNSSTISRNMACPSEVGDCQLHFAFVKNSTHINLNNIPKFISLHFFRCWRFPQNSADGIQFPGNERVLTSNPSGVFRTSPTLYHRSLNAYSTWKPSVTASCSGRVGRLMNGTRQPGPGP